MRAAPNEEVVMHVMIDLETTGTGSTAAIVAIGAVYQAKYLIEACKLGGVKL